MMTLECMVRGFGAELPRGAENVGRFADGGEVLGWKVAAAARVREKLERSGREEKRLKVLENRMVVVGWDWMGNGRYREFKGFIDLSSICVELGFTNFGKKVECSLDCCRFSCGWICQRVLYLE